MHRIVRGRPHPALAGLVKGYADFAERAVGPRETGEVPGRCVVVIVDLDTGWTVEGERFGSFAGGLYARPVRVRHEGSSAGVQIDLEPPAVRALLGVAAKHGYSDQAHLAREFAVLGGAPPTLFPFVQDGGVAEA